jgi:hypothetical protein
VSRTVTVDLSELGVVKQVTATLPTGWHFTDVGGYDILLEGDGQSATWLVLSDHLVLVAEGPENPEAVLTVRVQSIDEIKDLTYPLG